MTSPRVSLLCADWLNRLILAGREEEEETGRAGNGYTSQTWYFGEAGGRKDRQGEACCLITKGGGILT